MTTLDMEKEKRPPRLRGRLHLQWWGRAAHEDGTSLHLQDAEAVVQHREINVEAIGFEVSGDAPRTLEAIAGSSADRELGDTRRKFLVGHPLVDDAALGIGDGPVILLCRGERQDQRFAGQVRERALDGDGRAHTVDELVGREVHSQTGDARFADLELDRRSGRFSCRAGQHELSSYVPTVSFSGSCHEPLSFMVSPIMTVRVVTMSANIWPVDHRAITLPPCRRMRS